MPVPARFDLTAAVCFYGYYKLAPNHWDAAARTLHRPLRDAADKPVDVRITQPAGRMIRITCTRTLRRADHAPIKEQVARMLRMDEDFAGWHRLHPDAARRKFGRLFRSPTLFEDIIKTITSCNVAWSSTKVMNVKLCEHYGGGAFPTPGELAKATAGAVKERCRVGYRAERIVRLARDVHEGRIDLAWYEDAGRTTEELFAALVKIHGIGPYAANNILQHLGHYNRLAVDSELLRHLRQVHRIDGSQRHVTRAAERYYRQYAPYQFLAYWFELWTGYQERNAVL